MHWVIKQLFFHPDRSFTGQAIVPVIFHFQALGEIGFRHRIKTFTGGNPRSISDLETVFFRILLDSVENRHRLILRRTAVISELAMPRTDAYNGYGLYLLGIQR